MAGRSLARPTVASTSCKRLHKGGPDLFL
jgi:hypothetical protein